MRTQSQMSEPELLAVGRLAQAQEAMVKASEWEVVARSDRDAWICELRTLGWTLAECATLSGLSQGLIQQISERGGLVVKRVAIRA